MILLQVFKTIVCGHLLGIESLDDLLSQMNTLLYQEAKGEYFLITVYL